MSDLQNKLTQDTVKKFILYHSENARIIISELQNELTQDTVQKFISYHSQNMRQRLLIPDCNLQNELTRDTV